MKRAPAPAAPVVWRLDPGPPPALVSAQWDRVDLTALRSPSDLVLLLLDVERVASDGELADLVRKLRLFLDPAASLCGNPRKLSASEIGALVATAPTRAARRGRRAEAFPQQTVLELGPGRLQDIAAARTERLPRRRAR